MLQKMTQRPFWLVVGLLITSLQLSIAACALGMPMEQFETFLDEHRALIEYVSWLNGCAALVTVVGVVFVTLHVAGVL